MRTNLVLASVVIGAFIVFRLPGQRLSAQTASEPAPISFTAVNTRGDATLLYRMWSDGSIDVRLVNPMGMTANDWPRSDQPGLSFQDGWKALQVGK
jgi:hypothetical protein